MDFRRTTALALAPLLVLACKSDAPAGPEAPPDSVSFPASFLFGTATAGFQIEKGDSNTDWADFVKLQGKIKNGDTPDNGGPDALDHVDDDIALMTQTGQNAYRFSIEWGRLFPTKDSFDSNTPDPAALAAYDTEIQKLQNAHIAPMVTLFHWALPNWLSDVSKPSDPQGWERPETAAAFTQFCSRMAQHFGPSVDWWITLNEPLVYVTTGYLQGGSPPGVVLDANRAFAVARTFARVHASCFDAIHQADTTDADGDGKAAWVSVAAHLRTFHPLDDTNPDDVAATKHVEYLWNRWFLNATINGDWDDDIDGNYTGPNDVKGDPTLVHRMDYVGVNYYSDTLISAHTGLVIPVVNATVAQDHLPTDRPKTDVAWDIYPEGLRDVLLDVVKPYGLPVLITENGIADRADVNRSRFLTDHLYELGWAMKDGLDVRGYFHWSLIDNFEWQNGFCPKFGFASVDPTTGARTLRASGATYQKIISAKTIKKADLDALPPYQTTPFCP